MKRLVLIAVLLCSLAACEGRLPKLVDPQVVERGGLRYLARSTEPLTAYVEVWHENGQLKEQYSVIDGMIYYSYRSWHENGQPKEQYSVIDGKIEGLRNSWYENGGLDTESIYSNGKMTSSVGFYENGQQKHQFGPDSDFIMVDGKTFINGKQVD